jgi:hypothetical protein
MAWCPAQGCSNAFVARAVVKTVQCTCGMKFCFKCAREAHQPAGCDNLSKWLEKCGNESETANWILANTKKCPLCTVRIEKNQGCNHMVCRNKGCKHEFCWICLGPWADHGQSTGGYYKCNKFSAAAPEAGASDAARAKAELDKYLFYYQRYTNHDQAGKFAAKHREATQKVSVDRGGVWACVCRAVARLVARLRMSRVHFSGFGGVDGSPPDDCELLQLCVLVLFFLPLTRSRHARPRFDTCTHPGCSAWLSCKRRHRRAGRTCSSWRLRWKRCLRCVLWAGGRVGDGICIHPIQRNARPPASWGTTILPSQSFPASPWSRPYVTGTAPFLYKRNSFHHPLHNRFSFLASFRLRCARCSAAACSSTRTCSATT